MQNMKNTVKMVCKLFDWENNEVRHLSVQDRSLSVPRIYQVIHNSVLEWKAVLYIYVTNMKCKIIISTEILS